MILILIHYVWGEPILLNFYKLSSDVYAAGLEITLRNQALKVIEKSGMIFAQFYRKEMYIVSILIKG